jgi:hypothetical protein
MEDVMALASRALIVLDHWPVFSSLRALTRLLGVRSSPQLAWLIHEGMSFGVM